MEKEMSKLEQYFLRLSLFIVLLIILSGCKKSGDSQKQISASAEQSSAPAQHEVVSTVLEFIEATDTGDYDRAIELGVPNKFNRGQLLSINGGHKFNKTEIIGAYVSNKNSVVLATPVFTIGQAKDRVHFGFSLVKKRKRWLIHQLHIHYFLPDAKEWLAGFKDVEPDAKSVVGSG